MNVACVLLLTLSPAQQSRDPSRAVAAPKPADLASLRQRYEADFGALRRFHDVELDTRRHRRLRTFLASWLKRLDAFDASGLSEQDRKAWDKLVAEVLAARVAVEQEADRRQRVEPWLPFVEDVCTWGRQRQRGETVEPAAAAQALAEMVVRMGQLRADLKTSDAGVATLTQAAEAAAQLEKVLAAWHGFYDGYDPLFTWWMRAPYPATTAALAEYRTALREAAVRAATADADPAEEVPDVAAVLAPPVSPLAPLIGRYAQERRRWDGRRPMAPAAVLAALKRWRERLDVIDYDGLAADARIDWQLLAAEIDYQLRVRELDRLRDERADLLMPFAPALADLLQGKGDGEVVAAEVRTLTAKVAAALAAGGQIDGIGPTAELDQELAARLRVRLEEVSGKADTLPPAVAEALGQYLKVWDDRIETAGLRAVSGILAKPVGRERLLAALAREQIPYTPERLMDIARRELDWCHREYAKAASEMGAPDWREAVARIKRRHEPPGGQPALVRMLAAEAVEFLDERDLVTVPVLARETWRMRMMSPEAQLVNPFFLGGEVIHVAYPTDAMGHDVKLRSMLGNNLHMARATVHHELIPGHHLQQFMTQRHRPHREALGTPFWTEGWALYWEMRLWDLGFPQSPEDRIGMLVWRTHRCARILFSLGFHLGEMTPVECIDLLVERVGFERRNATAEVRRSFAGAYPPLYQAAYMLGGLQIRELHRELVAEGSLSERRFHDAVLHQNRMPIALVRAALAGQDVPRSGVPPWYFDGPADGKGNDNG